MSVIHALRHPSHHRSWIEVDLDAVAHNVRVFRHLMPARGQVTAVLKADAYGHGAVACARTMLAAGATRLAVATCLEGEELRRAGVDAPVQILGATLPEEVAPAVDAGLILSVHELDVARLASLAALKRRTVATVHLKIDTGMGRLGILPHDAVRAARAVGALPAVRLEGIFTHFADAGDEAYSRQQLATFLAVARQLEAAGVGDADPADAAPLGPDGPAPPRPAPDAESRARGQGTGLLLKHAASSGAALMFPEAHFDAIRPGCALYGYTSPGWLARHVALRPALTWRCVVAQIKDYPRGLSLGYNRTFTTHRPTRVAVLPVGYADGYLRSFSNRAEVLIKGRRAAVVGIVSMDYAMVDVTDFADDAVEVGSIATLIGADGDDRIRLEELAERGDTIPYCITTGLGRRPGRGYVDAPPGGPPPSRRA